MISKYLFVFFITSCLAFSSFAQQNPSTAPSENPKKFTVFGNAKLRLSSSYVVLRADEYNYGRGILMHVGIETKFLAERFRLYPELTISDRVKALSLSFNLDILRTRSKELALTLSAGVNNGDNEDDDIGFQGGLGTTFCPKDSRFSLEFLPLSFSYYNTNGCYGPKLTLKYKL